MSVLKYVILKPAFLKERLVRHFSVMGVVDFLREGA